MQGFDCCLFYTFFFFFLSAPLYFLSPRRSRFPTTFLTLTLLFSLLLSFSDFALAPYAIFLPSNIHCLALFVFYCYLRFGCVFLTLSFVTPFSLLIGKWKMLKATTNSRLVFCYSNLMHINVSNF